jgi:hypothetical protein
MMHYCRNYLPKKLPTFQFPRTAAVGNVMKRVEYLPSLWHGDDKRMEEYRPSWFKKPVMAATQLMVGDETISNLREHIHGREQEITHLRAELARRDVSPFAVLGHLLQSLVDFIFRWKKHPPFAVVVPGLFLVVLALVKVARCSMRRHRLR